MIIDNVFILNTEDVDMSIHLKQFLGRFMQ